MESWHYPLISSGHPIAFPACALPAATQFSSSLSFLHPLALASRLILTQIQIIHWLTVELPVDNGDGGERIPHDGGYRRGIK